MTTMERDPLFDPRISEWLEDDPDIAPGMILETVVAAFPSIPQRRARRVPWRFPTMSIPVRIAAVAALVVLVAAGAVFLQRPQQGLVGGPSPSPEASPSPTASPSASSSAALIDLPDTFTSPTYGYSISLPPNMVITPATLTWTGPDNSTAVVDDMSFPDGGGINGASEPLRAGQTWAQWLNEFQPPSLIGGCNGPAPSEWTPIQIGTEAGAWQQMCNGGEAVVQVGDRAYVFAFGESSHLSFDQFKHVLASVRFDPSATTTPAPPPALDQTFTSSRFGYSLSYPSGATASRATTAPNGLMPNLAVGEADTITDDSARSAIWSVALEPGQTAEEWAGAYCQVARTEWTQPCDGAPGNWREVPLASGSAWLMVDGDSAGEYVHQESRLFTAVATAGDRMYVIRTDGLLNENLFLAILASMQLDPTAAK